MIDTVVARRYANAIFALGKKDGDEALSCLLYTSRAFYPCKWVDALTLYESAAHNNVAWIQPGFSRCDGCRYP